eukprot:4815157-Amphidinium_carterae.3
MGKTRHKSRSCSSSDRSRRSNRRSRSQSPRTPPGKKAKAANSDPPNKRERRELSDKRHEEITSALAKLLEGQESISGKVAQHDTRLQHCESQLAQIPELSHQLSINTSTIDTLQKQVNELSLGQKQMSTEVAKSTKALQSGKSSSTKPAEQDRVSRTAVISGFPQLKREDLIAAIREKFTLPPGTNIFTRDMYEKEAFVEFPTDFDQRTFLASHRNLSEPVKHTDGSQLWIGPDFSAEDRRCHKELRACRRYFAKKVLAISDDQMLLRIKYNKRRLVLWVDDAIVVYHNKAKQITKGRGWLPQWDFDVLLACSTRVSLTKASPVLNGGCIEKDKMDSRQVVPMENVVHLGAGLLLRTLVVVVTVCKFWAELDLGMLVVFYTVNGVDMKSSDDSLNGC